MQVFLSFFSAFPANRKERKMSVSALAMSQHNERNILSIVSNTWSQGALDDCIKTVLGAHARGLIGDGVVESVYSAVTDRRAALITQQRSAARRPAKWGLPLAAGPKLSLDEKRSRAKTRHNCAGWFSAKLEKAGANVAEIYEKLPRASVRAVLHTICELCALARGRCDASIATIADRAGCSRSAVEQALHHLKAGGFIEIESGKAAGVTSIIRPAQQYLTKVVAWCRARLEKTQKKMREADRSASVAGGTQINGKKSDSYFLNKRFGQKDGRDQPEDATEAVVFPATGSIYFTRWRDLVRTHSTGVTPDADIVANAFRKFCKEKNIALDAPKIEDRFIKIVQKFRI
ncbi:hypothetical protein [Agrobacterium tumefaciens]|uniref:hypothetical protein n=1 Tax=Agrobacterium tumefaciens TaxID=358 RepID=UPI003B9F8F18